MVIILLIATSILNVIDYLQTTYAVQLLGVKVEANPIGRFLFKYNCEWIKLIIVPILLAVIGLVIKVDKRYAWVAWLLLIFYIAVVVNNFVILDKII